MNYKEYLEPEWVHKYELMLDAIINYLDDMHEKNYTSVNERDIRIIKALIEFYDFQVLDNQDIIDIMDDVKVRVSELDEIEKGDKDVI